MNNGAYAQEHAPSFPSYVQYNTEKVRWDTLAHSYGNGTITTIDGEIFRCRNYEELEQAMFHETEGATEKTGCALLLFLEKDVASFSLFDECIEKSAEGRCEIMANSENSPTYIKIRSSNGHRSVRVAYITSRLQFPWKKKSPQEFLTLCDQLFRYCNVGTASSLATLGTTLLRQSFLEAFGKDWKRHKHSRPPLGVLRSLKSIEPHGMVETPGKGKEFESGYAIDGKNMYGSQLVELPTGTAIAIRKGSYSTKELLDMYQYIIAVRCDCVIKEELPLGVFPFRDTTGRTIQPRAVGTYTGVAMGRDQIKECLLRGVEVKNIEGWGWETTTDDCTWFVRTMEQLRDYAPSEELRTAIKIAFVSTIGVMGMSYIQHTITTPEQAGEVRTSWTGDIFHEFGVQEKAQVTKPCMTHWHYKAIDATRASITHEAYPFAERGQLIAIDTDEMLVERCEEAKAYTKKSDAPFAPSGTYLRTLHTHLHNIKDRTYQSDQKDKRPGVSEERRKTG